MTENLHDEFVVISDEKGESLTIARDNFISLQVIKENDGNRRAIVRFARGTGDEIDEASLYGHTFFINGALVETMLTQTSIDALGNKVHQSAEEAKDKLAANIAFDFIHACAAYAGPNGSSSPILRMADGLSVNVRVRDPNEAMAEIARAILQKVSAKDTN